MASVKQEYDKAYETIAEKTRTLELFRDDYKILKNRLKTLPDKIEHEALVPLGSKALGFGKVIHTNEILCMLGDSWFMECSSKTAMEIVDRRIKKCNKHLEEQQQEADRLENWKSSLTKLIVESMENDSLEIVEEVNDDDYGRMAEEHRENVKRHHVNIAKERSEKSPEELQEENEKFWARLEELELEEEMMQAEKEYAKRKKASEPAKVSKPSRSGKSVTFSDQNEVRIIPKETKQEAKYSDIVKIRNDQPAPAENEEASEKPSTSRGGPFDPRVDAAPPKKNSLFKQRRQQ
ncbi:unnamed protein product [Allacma fusca]|uniref:Unconventional prefoldin RPB5 interactor n=1 Tax=Allacma fusca TaxID=39272 RepID=A0A8J2PBT7_9HEXA|nr:unnamed protein product [Allacma fusca]